MQKRLRQALDSLSVPLEPLTQKKRRILTSFSPHNLAPRPRSLRDNSINAQSSPNYLPYSVEAYHQRLLTFGDASRWTQEKPVEIGASEAARCGWVILDSPTQLISLESRDEASAIKTTERDRVRCQVCEVSWRVGVDESLFKEAFCEKIARNQSGGSVLTPIHNFTDRKAVRLLSAQFTLAHLKSCPWQFVRLMCGPKTAARQELTSRRTPTAAMSR